MSSVCMIGIVEQSGPAMLKMLQGHVLGETGIDL
jgi:hypothetical protein